MTTNYGEIKSRIMKEGMLVRVQTVLGTAVKITKRDACKLLDILEKRSVEPSVSFDEIRPGRYLVSIDDKKAPQEEIMKKSKKVSLFEFGKVSPDGLKNMIIDDTVSPIDRLYSAIGGD